ncbi:MAG TPA: hypothetical protein VIY49_37400 [Bryobacteraceae bacterium]
MQPVKPLLVRGKDLAPLHMREHTIGGFKCGRVCAGCNNGWMSKLEDDIKAILIGVIEGSRPLNGLNENERFLLARWTLKTVAALNRSSTYGDPRREDARVMPEAHLRTLKAGTMPAEVLIVATIFREFTKPFDFLQNAIWTNPKNSMSLEEEHRNQSYKIGLSFGQLILIAAYYPSHEYFYGINTKAHFPLCSGRRIVPMDHIWDDSPGKSLAPHLEVPMRNVSVISQTWQRLVDNVAFTSLADPFGLGFR